MLQLIICVLVVLFTVYLIYKKYNTALVMFLSGLIMLYFAAFITGKILPANAATGLLILDPFKVVQMTFLDRMGMIGLTIMVLFGYTAYMNKIGANRVAIETLTAPLCKIKSPYVLVPIVFLFGNFLSLVVPSASSLGVLLMATLFPILVKARFTALTAAGVIATTATIVPTPLGADNIIAAKLFNMPVMEYLSYHCRISIPALLVMAVAHYFWQKHCDSKEDPVELKELESKIDALKTNDNIELPPKAYTILPFLPLINVLVLELIVKNLFVKNLSVDIATITLISLFIAVVVESIRKKSFKTTSDEVGEFFSGMGRGFAIVVTLLIGATVFVEGIKSLGIVTMMLNATKDLSGAAYVYSYGFAFLTAIVGFISGSGLSMFYSIVDLISPIASNLGVNPASLALPMQLFGNLVRSVSPVAAVIVIVASFMKVNPIKIVKRTSVPILAGMVSVLILSTILL